MAVYAHLVVNSATETDKPVANVVVKATAEEPQIEIQTTSLSGSGELLWGKVCYEINVGTKGCVLISCLVPSTEIRE